MPNVGVWEILLVLLVALIVFGPKRLPEMGRSLGRGIREFKDSVSAVTPTESDFDEPREVQAAPVPDEAAEPVPQTDVEAETEVEVESEPAAVSSADRPSAG